MFVPSSILRRFRGRGRQATTVRKSVRVRLQLEALDARLVPTVFHVSTLADGGAGSLRDAITQANAHHGKNYNPDSSCHGILLPVHLGLV